MESWPMQYFGSDRRQLLPRHDISTLVRTRRNTSIGGAVDSRVIQLAFSVFANWIWRALLQSTNPVLTSQSESTALGSRFSIGNTHKRKAVKNCSRTLADAVGYSCSRTASRQCSDCGIELCEPICGNLWHVAQSSARPAFPSIKKRSIQLDYNSRPDDTRRNRRSPSAKTNRKRRVDEMQDVLRDIIARMFDRLPSPNCPPSASCH